MSEALSVRALARKLRLQQRRCLDERDAIRERYHNLYRQVIVDFDEDDADELDHVLDDPSEINEAEALTRIMARKAGRK